ncbi:hypothetical protein Tco_0446599 [Tanacetum coccineum]
METLLSFFVRVDLETWLSFVGEIDHVEQIYEDLLGRRCDAKNSHRKRAKVMKRVEVQRPTILVVSALRNLEIRQVAEEMEAREATRTLEPLNENGDEQEGENRGNGNRGN